MKKRDKLIAGLIIGGAIGSVLGIMIKNKDSDKTEVLSENTPHTEKDMDSMLKPKRKGIILRFLDWLDHKN